jgi:pimeloyl-ACP methyl ester carboxylesterase
LIAFTRSRLSAICAYPTGDLGLLEEVLQIPNCRVVIAHGSKDAIVPQKLIQKIKSRFPTIDYICFEGQGHDPFEEQPDLFVNKIYEVIRKDSVN